MSSGSQLKQSIAFTELFRSISVTKVPEPGTHTTTLAIMSTLKKSKPNAVQKDDNRAGRCLKCAVGWARVSRGSQPGSDIKVRVVLGRARSLSAEPRDRRRDREKKERKSKGGGGIINIILRDGVDHLSKAED